MTRARPQALPPGLPGPSALQTLVFWRWPLAYLTRARDRYGARFTLHATSRPPLVFLSDPCEIKAMFAADPNVLCPGEGADTIEPLVGARSFMLSEDREHIAGRKTILPPLGTSTVQEHRALLSSTAAAAFERWPREVSFQLHPWLRSLTLENILRTVFGPSAHPNEHQLLQLRDRLLALLTVTASAVLSEPLLRHGPGRSTWKRFLAQRDAVDRLLYSIISERQRGRTSSSDLFDRLLGAREPAGSLPTPRQIRDDLMSIVLAGHETTASELAWAFQLLAHNPRVQERLVEELDSDDGEAYLTATVQEVLRHRPVFLFAIPRAVKRPIEIGGWTYRPSAQLLACIYLLHHNPDVYPDPDRFLPERFLQGTPPPPLWLPWGGGRKRCPGQHLAMLEMKTVLSTVLNEATVLPARERIERARWRSVIVTPHRGCEVVLQPRRRPKSVATRH